MFMACHVGDRIALGEVLAQGDECFVLSIFEAASFQAFELDAHRVVVAVGPAAVERLPRVPGPGIDIDALNQAAISANKKVR